MLSHSPRSWAFFVLISTVTGSAAAETSRTRCPAGQRPSLSGCVDGSSQARARATPEAQAKPKGPKAVPKPDPALTVARAKVGWSETRTKQLLIQELIRLEAMLDKTPENSPDHPVILRRLAEGYAELEMIAERERAKSQAAADVLEQSARDDEKAKKPKQPQKRGSGTVL
jgi:hypothetical protein